MHDVIAAFGAAAGLILNFDARLADIVLLSLRVTLTAVAIAVLIGLPVGAMLGIARFPGRGPLHRPVQRPDGPAAGRRRASGLSGAIPLRPARRLGPALHPNRHDHRPSRARPAHRHLHHAADGRGHVARIRGATTLPRLVPLAGHPDADLGRPLQPADGSAGRLRPRQRRSRRRPDRRRQHRRLYPDDDHGHHAGDGAWRSASGAGAGNTAAGR